MREKLASLLSGFFYFMLLLAILWGEVVGTGHAFWKHSITDGIAAIALPPWAWYRGIEFFWHNKLEDQTGKERPVRDYPPTTVDEEEVLTRISSKAVQEPLTQEDLTLYRNVVEKYGTRTGKFVVQPEIVEFLEIRDKTSRYKRELGRCLLISISSKRPFISGELKDLRQQMEKQALITSAKLDSDIRKLKSAANGTVSIDEQGIEYAPLTRDDVLQELKNIDMVDENFRRMAAVLEEVSAAPHKQ